MIKNVAISAGIGVSIPLTGTGKIFFPELNDLKGRVIKYIDFYDVQGAYDVDYKYIAPSNDGSLSLMEYSTKNFPIQDVPLSVFSVARNTGKRFLINRVIDIPNSYIQINNVSGNNLFFVFWYDLEESAETMLENDVYSYDTFNVIRRNRNSTGIIPFSENRTLFGKEFGSLRFQFGLNMNVVDPSVPSEYSYIDSNTAKSIYITLQNGSFKFIRNVPLMLLGDYNYNNYNQLQLNRDGINFKNVKFDFTNSYLQFPTQLDTRLFFCQILAKYKD